MPAVSTDWVSRLAATTSSNKATNGGLPGTTDLVSNRMAAIFPVWLPDELTAGGTLYRKVFHACEDTGNTGAGSCRHLILGQCDGGDDITFCSPYSWDDVEDDIDESAVSEDDWYGVGVLQTSLTAGVSTSIVVTVKSATRKGFALHSGALKVFVYDSVNGTSEQVDISNVSGGSTTQTLTIASAGTIANSYTAASTVSISAMMDVNSPGATTGVVLAYADEAVVTSSAGTFDDDEVEVINAGTREDTITLTVAAGGVTFTAVSTNYGALTAGAMASDYSPVDALGRIIVTVNAAAWGGTWAQGDTVVIDTHPSGFFIWYRQVVPAGAAGQSNDRTIFRTRFAAL